MQSSVNTLSMHSSNNTPTQCNPLSIHTPSFNTGCGVTNLEQHNANVTLTAVANAFLQVTPLNQAMHYITPTYINLALDPMWLQVTPLNQTMHYITPTYTNLALDPMWLQVTYPFNAILCQHTLSIQYSINAPCQQ